MQNLAKICQEGMKTRNRENLENTAFLGKIEQNMEVEKHDKSTFHLPRQHTNRADSSEIKESAPFLWNMCQVK